MTVDFPDWMTQAQQELAGFAGVTTQIQQLITAAGVPLLHGYNALQTGTVLTAAGGAQAFSGADFEKIGYNIGLQCSIANVAATNPFVLVELTWQDVTHANSLSIERYYVPLASSGTTFVFGKGPAKGPHLSLRVLNFDPAFTATVVLTLLECTHHLARDDWRCNFGNNVPGFTLIPGQDVFGLVLGGIGGGGVAIGAGLSKVYLMPLYAGQINIALNMSVAGNTDVFVYAQDPNLAAAVPIFNQRLTVIEPPPLLVTLPRAPCTLTITNATAGAITYQFGVTALEYAS
jgi:hypothetical protein